MLRCTIIGAGPVGTLMALLLARRGHLVQMFERRSDPRSTQTDRGRSINLALAARGTAALQQAGVLARVVPQMIAMSGRMVHDEQQPLQFLPYGQNEREVIYAVSREHLNRVLIEAAAEQPGIEINFDQCCIDIDPATGALQLRDQRSGTQRQVETQIVLAADGAGSSVRAALQRAHLSRVIDAPLVHDYKELLIRPRQVLGPHGHYAFEAHALHIWPRGGFMLIALPNLDGGFTATLFLARNGVVSFDSLDSDDAIQTFFEREFPDATRVLPDLALQFAQHPQARLGTITCEGWSAAGRVLLLGDAAHAIVPFHGQGLNCGFEDCGILDRLLAAASDTEQAFAAFERERFPDTSAIAAMALENYEEMRDSVRSPQFAQRKTMAAQLERRFPGRFVPRYSMVTFHPEISYAQARRRGEQQERILDALIGQFGFAALTDEALTVANRMLQQAGL
jgi:kynurenine 3-monooxygenase